MRLMAFGTDALPNFTKLSLNLATPLEECREIQQLRYRVFVETMGIESPRNCGKPAWDPEFHSADLFMMLPLAPLDSRYACHYLKEGVLA